ncbi:hypothetical protein GCM10027287_34960 [Bordetella muralis]
MRSGLGDSAPAGDSVKRFEFGDEHSVLNINEAKARTLSPGAAAPQRGGNPVAKKGREANP